MKDKPQMATTMQDVARNQFPNEEGKKDFFMLPDVKSKKKVYDPDRVIDGSYTDSAQKNYLRNQEEITKYNESILTLDETYTSFTPYRFVLVRVFKKNYVALGGSDTLIAPPETMVAPLTQNGIGHLKKEVCPWSFDNKAIVISAPEYHKVHQSGDIVQLDRSVIISVKQGNDGTFNLPYGFIIAGNGFDVPVSMSDPNFGYILIPDNLILGTIKKNKNDA